MAGIPGEGEGEGEGDGEVAEVEEERRFLSSSTKGGRTFLSAAWALRSGQTVRVVRGPQVAPSRLRLTGILLATRHHGRFAGASDRAAGRKTTVDPSARSMRIPSRKDRCSLLLLGTKGLAAGRRGVGGAKVSLPPSS